MRRLSLHVGIIHEGRAGSVHDLSELSTTIIPVVTTAAAVVVVVVAAAAEAAFSLV